MKRFFLTINYFSGNPKAMFGTALCYSDAGYYVSCIDAYLRLQYPERHFEIINVGLPSETVSGLSEPDPTWGKFPLPDLHERLDRILNKLKPDLVFAC